MIHIDWDKMPLGFVYDEDLAAFLVCHVDTVANARKARNIPAKSRQRTKWQKKPGFIDEVGLRKEIATLKKQLKEERRQRSLLQGRLEAYEANATEEDRVQEDLDVVIHDKKAVDQYKVAVKKQKENKTKKRKKKGGARSKS